MRFFLAFLLLSCLLHAKGSATLLKRGNAAYSAGKLDEAMKLYDEALVESPENPYLIFNRAVVLFKQGDYEKARDEFKSTLDKLPNLKRSDSKLECRAWTAIGNCGFFLAKKYADLEVDNAIKLCLESIQAYENTLRFNAKDKRANKNIAASRMLLKKLLGIKYMQAQQQRQQEELGRKIKELAERQKKAADNTAKTDKASGTEELQKEQENINNETEEIAKQLQPQGQPPQGQPPQGQAPQGQAPQGQQENPLSQTRQAQDEALEKLKSNDLKDAENKQREAAEKLDEMLKQSEQQQQQQQQKQNDDENSEQKQNDSGQQDDSGEKKQDNKQESSEEQQQDAEKEKQEAAAEEQEMQDSASEQDAREIIDKERHDKREREKNRRGNYRAVPMDW